MIYLDTNVLIRFFTKDDKEKAAKVAKLLQTEKEIEIVDVVFPEIEYVLLNVYETNRKDITKAFKFIISLPNIKLKESIKKAVSLYEKSKLDMADCIIQAYSINGILASFDKNLLKTPGVKAYW